MTENLYHPDSIRTFTGKYVNPLNPDPDTICIEDIAHALSQICRFGGHLPYFYSVADHSLAVSYCLPDEHALAGLLHDASEAYLCDIPSPVKRMIPGYAEAEDRLMKVIAAKFGFPWPVPEMVKVMDRERLETEWKNIMIDPMPLGHAHPKQDFLARFYILTR